MSASDNWFHSGLAWSLLTVWQQLDIMWLMLHNKADDPRCFSRCGVTGMERIKEWRGGGALCIDDALPDHSDLPVSQSLTRWTRIPTARRRFAPRDSIIPNIGWKAADGSFLGFR